MKGTSCLYSVSTQKNLVCDMSLYIIAHLHNLIFIYIGALPVYLDVLSNKERKGFNGVLCSCDTLRYLDDDCLVQDDYINAIHKSLFP